MGNDVVINTVLLIGSHTTRYKYLNNITSVSASKIGSKKALQGYTNLLQVMKQTGFEESEIAEIQTTIGVILHFGNIVFDSNSDRSNVSVDPSGAVREVAELAQIGIANLVSQLCTTMTELRGEKIQRLKTPEQAEEGRDATAKSIYARMFAWIVAKINAYLVPSTDEKNWFEIGVLDIFGFENHAENSYEQLCINVANEQLQFFFNQFTFAWELEDLKRAGISTKEITYKDNRSLLDQLLRQSLNLCVLSSSIPLLDVCASMPICLTGKQACPESLAQCQCEIVKWCEE